MKGINRLLRETNEICRQYHEYVYFATISLNEKKNNINVFCSIFLN